MRWTVGRKLGFGFGGVLVMLSMVAAVGFYASVRANHNIHRVNDMTVDTAVGADAAQAMLRARMSVKNFLISNTDADAAAYEKWKASFLESLKRSKSSFSNEQRQTLVAGITEDFVVYDATFEQVRELIDERNRIRAEVLDVVGKRATDEIKEVLYQLFHNGQAAYVEKVMPALLDLLEGRLYVMKFLGNSAEGDYERATAELERSEELLGQVVAGISLPEARELLAKAHEDLVTYREGFVRVHDLVLERNRLVFDTLDVKGPHIIELQHEIQESLVDDGEAVTAQAEKEVKLAEAVIVAVSAVALLLGIGAAFLISRMVTRPVKACAATLELVSAGDLTQTVTVKQKDELGDLAHGINGMVTTMRAALGDVQGATHEVAGASTELSANAEQMSASMVEQTERMQQINAAIEEMGRAVVDIAEKSVSASSTAQKAGDSAEQGGTIVAQTVDGMEAISDAVASSATSVQELGKRGEQIGEIVATINDIADQTNLLALNAAIEAARAGEHGRGFAVVADEVRKLADRTTQATEEIAESITAIQTETTQAVQRMQSGTEQVSEGVESAKLAGDSLNQIVANASDVSGMIQSIAAATEEQSATAEQINRAVGAADASIREAAEGSRQASEAVLSLSRKAEELQSLVGRFKL